VHSYLSELYRVISHLVSYMYRFKCGQVKRHMCQKKKQKNYLLLFFGSKKQILDRLGIIGCLCGGLQVSKEHAHSGVTANAGVVGLTAKTSLMHWLEMNFCLASAACRDSHGWCVTPNGLNGRDQRKARAWHERPMLSFRRSREGTDLLLFWSQRAYLLVSGACCSEQYLYLVERRRT